MPRTVFDFEKVDALRKAAGAVDATLGGDSDLEGGWTKSPADPMDVLTVFTLLRIKAGYVLRAYWLRAGVAANGIVWAMPIEAPFPEPEECESRHGMVPVPGVGIEAPRPPEAIDNFMEAIEGDGTSWSYLCASLFEREARELGARWHGVAWGARTILAGDPWEGVTGEGEGAFHRPSERSEFTFHEPEPEHWGPTFHHEGDTPAVMFHTYCGEAEQRITRIVDRFGQGGYRFTTEAAAVASGPMGYIP